MKQVLKRLKKRWLNWKISYNNFTNLSIALSALSVMFVLLLYIMFEGTELNLTMQNSSPAVPPMLISSLFKLFGASRGGTAVPFLQDESVNVHAQDSYCIVDVGVFNGIEAARAVERGFTVFGFEPITPHIHAVTATFDAKGLSKFLRFVNLTKILVDDFGGELSMLKQSFERNKDRYPLADRSANEGKGMMYLFQAAVAHDFGQSIMQNAGLYSNMNATTKHMTTEHSTVVHVPVSSIVFHDVFWFKTGMQLA